MQLTVASIFVLRDVLTVRRTMGEIVGGNSVLTKPAGRPPVFITRYWLFRFVQKRAASGKRAVSHGPSFDFFFCVLTALLVFFFHFHSRAFC